MCQCLEIIATPTSTGVQETVDVNGVLVEGFYTYNFTIGGDNFTIYWDGEQWSLFAVVDGDDIFVGSNNNIDCPTGTWNLSPSEGAHYFAGGFATAECTGPTQEEIDCFNALVWQKQCEYSKEVLKYLQALEFGFACCDALEDLKNERRVLLILNCYDTRDLGAIVPKYNTLTYSQIKNLLEY
jgi:hypothetical protein